jgi:hypothetical protein
LDHLWEVGRAWAPGRRPRLRAEPAPLPLRHRRRRAHHRLRIASTTSQSHPVRASCRPPWSASTPQDGAGDVEIVELDAGRAARPRPGHLPGADHQALYRPQGGDRHPASRQTARSARSRASARRRAGSQQRDTANTARPAEPMARRPLAGGQGQRLSAGQSDGDLEPSAAATARAMRWPGRPDCSPFHRTHSGSSAFAPTVTG